MNCIGVECNADKYFFGRLLNDKKLIRKERNDIEVIRGVVERSKGNFSVGIIDVDKNKKMPDTFIQLKENDNTQIYKHNDRFQFLILIGPRQFEHWIRGFLTLKNKNIEDFDFIDFNQFMECSKSINPEKDERFKSVIDYVFECLEDEHNHILELKKQLRYIIEKRYNFDIDEFNNI